jgi:hypothetical protein
MWPHTVRRRRAECLRNLVDGAGFLISALRPYHRQYLGENAAARHPSTLPSRAPAHRLWRAGQFHLLDGPRRRRHRGPSRAAAEDAIAYEASGMAKEVVAKVKTFFAGPPTLRSYRVKR